MLSNRLAFAALAVACVAAAAGGGYLATQQNAVPAPAAAQTVAVTPTANALTPATQSALPSTTSAAPAADASRPVQPVQETEAMVGERPDRTAAAESSRNTRRADAARSTRDSRPPSSQMPASTSVRRDQVPALQGTWPSSAAQTPATSTAPASAPESPARADTFERAQESTRAPENSVSSRPTFEELVISADSVMGLQMVNRVSSETARVEDRVEARVARDVKVGDRVAIPAGSIVTGTVTQVERGGKLKDTARLGVRFHTVTLAADQSKLPISTETIWRTGEEPSRGSAAKIGGGAAIGAIIGAIAGGGKGAAIGATAGAGGGTAAVMAGQRSEVVLQPGTPLTVRLVSPVTVTVEKE